MIPDSDYEKGSHSRSFISRKHENILAGFLTQFAPKSLPISKKQWHCSIGVVLNYTAAGTVPGLNRIPFYADE